MTEKGLCYLSECLGNIICLQEIYVYYERFEMSDVGVQKIVENLGKLAALGEVTFSWRREFGMTKEEREKIVEVLKSQ